MKAETYDFLFITLLVLYSSYNSKMIKDIIPHKAGECYAPNSYKTVNETHTKECKQMLVKNYFTKTFDFLKLDDCLEPYNFMDINESYAPKLSNYCYRKNRCLNVYPYKGMGLSNTSDSFYLEAAKFDGKLVLKDDVYKYVRGTNPTKGFIVATSSPIGNKKDITGDPFFNKNCGGPNGFVKKNGNPRKCFNENLQYSDGSSQKDNTILSFYKNLKPNKIDYVIMLSDFIDVQKKNNKDCYCQNKSDKYFPFSNETFTIKKSNHIDNSDYSVTGKEDNEMLKHFFDYSKDAKDFLDARELTLKNKNESDYKFKHIHYKHWPDHQAPEGKGRKILMELVSLIKNKIDNGANVIVHCGCGTGRTAVFVTSVLTSGLDSTKNFNYFKFITELRKQRPTFLEHPNYSTFVFENMKKTSKYRLQNLSELEKK